MTVDRVRPKRGGFTLVELLVVLGIIAVLTAILFPVFLRARESARQATCTAHMQQLYQAAKMYSDDHDRTIVPARIDQPGTGNRGITWCVILQPYIKNDKILTCPSDPDPTATDQSTCLPHSYGINYLLSFNARYGPYPFVASYSFVQRPADTVLFFELKSTAKAMGSSYYSERISRVDFRHRDLADCAFMDGHVKAKRPAELNDARVWDPFS